MHFYLFLRFSMEAVSVCKHFTLLLLLLHFLAVSSATEDNLVINTKHGKVQGKLLSVPGGNVRAFLGIPYGKPPLGKLRFRAPEPAEAWDGVRDATKFPNSCYQIPDTAFPGRWALLCVYMDTYLYFVQLNIQVGGKMICCQKVNQRPWSLVNSLQTA